MLFRERLQSWRYNLVPDHIVGEVLSKRWADSAIPFVALIATIAIFGAIIPGFFKPSSLQSSTRQLGEFAIVVTGISVVMLAGGIDLSVGAVLALATFAAVFVFFILGQPVWLAFLAAVATGLLFGAVNGYLVGYLRLRAFLTTLVTFIFGRALFDILVTNYAADVQLSDASSSVLDFIGDGTFYGPAISVWAALVLALLAHVWLTRTRPGWHVLAVGGARRSAHNAGVRVRRVVFLTYVFSGFCASIAGFLLACRLGAAGPGTGVESGDHGADRRSCRRSKSRRRSWFGAEGANGRDHRAHHDERPDPTWLWDWHEPDGPGPPACRGCDA